MSALLFHMIGGAPDPVAPFSHAVEADGWIFLTGQMPFTTASNRSPYPATIEEQTRQVMDNLTAVLAGCGLRLDDVEDARVLARRFVVSAMSVGALSPEAHQALTIGIQRAGGAANTGEGGEDPAWYAPDADGRRRDARIKQVASARFGVTATYLARADQLAGAQLAGAAEVVGVDLAGVAVQRHDQARVHAQQFDEAAVVGEEAQRLGVLAGRVGGNPRQLGAGADARGQVVVQGVETGRHGGRSQEGAPAQPAIASK